MPGCIQSVNQPIIQTTGNQAVFQLVSKTSTYCCLLNACVFSREESVGRLAFQLMGPPCVAG